MSIEQWGVLALFTLLPLLEGLARLRRTHGGHSDPTDRVNEVRTSGRGLALPNRDAGGPLVREAKQAASRLPALPPASLESASPPAVSRSGLPANRTLSSKGSAYVEGRTRTVKPVADDAVVQWLRPVRNLRRAVVVATILGPPPHLGPPTQ